VDFTMRRSTPRQRHLVLFNPRLVQSILYQGPFCASGTQLCKLLCTLSVNLLHEAAWRSQMIIRSLAKIRNYELTISRATLISNTLSLIYSKSSPRKKLRICHGYYLHRVRKIHNCNKNYSASPGLSQRPISRQWFSSCS
jgi:hypothetical protein